MQKCKQKVCLNKNCKSKAKEYPSTVKANYYKDSLWRVWTGYDCTHDLVDNKNHKKVDVIHHNLMLRRRRQRRVQILRVWRR